MRFFYSILLIFIFLKSIAQEYVGFNIHLSQSHSDLDIYYLKSKLKLTAEFNNSFNSRKGHKFLLFELTKRSIDQQGFKLLKEDLNQYSFIEYVSPIRKINSQNYVSHLQEIIVKSYETLNNDTVIKWANKLKLDYEGEYEKLSNTYIFSINKNTTSSLDQVCDYFNQKTTIKWVNKNSFFSLMVSSEPDDQYYHRQWHINNIGSIVQFSGTPGADMEVEKAWETTTGDPNIKIAILDSGVDTLHPDLIKNLLSGYDALEQGSKGYPRSETDSISYSNDSHGTACAGIVGAEANNSIGVAGVAYSCKIIPIRIFIYVDLGGEKIGFTSNLWASNAINWAYLESDADILSNSYGLPDYLIDASGIDTALNNAILSDAIKNGRNGLGLPCLFSAGNEDDSIVIWPSNINSTIAVSASTMCDELKTIGDCSNETWSSNYGKGLDIAAPGVKIPTTDMIGSKGYNITDYFLTFNGTSAACPNAAAVVGLILSINNDFTLEEVYNILYTTVEKPGGYNYYIDKEYGTWSDEFGYGRVNAYNAIQKALILNDSINSISDSIFIYNDGIGNTYLGVSCIEDKFISYEIYNMLGQSIYFTNMKYIPSGRHYYTLNNTFPKGTYIVKVNLDNKELTRLVLF